MLFLRTENLTAGCRVMIPDQNRFRTVQPKLNKPQPASEVQLQPNGDESSIGCLASCWQRFKDSPPFGTDRKEGFLRGKQRTQRFPAPEYQRTEDCSIARGLSDDEKRKQ